MATRRFLSDILRGEREPRAPSIPGLTPETVSPSAAPRPREGLSPVRRPPAPAARRFAPIDVASACDLVVDAIEREIVSGRLAAGEPVGTEAALCSQFGVNRSTVREAIRVLEQGGLVRRGTDRRLYVGASASADATGRMSRLLLLRDVTGREAWDALRALEIASAAGAAAAGGRADLEQLDDNLAATEAAGKDSARLAALDAAFHDLVAGASGNRAVALLRAPLATLLFPATELAGRHAGDAGAGLVSAHRAIVAALRARDAGEAALAMSRHLAEWRRSLERAGAALDEPMETLFERAGLRLPGRALGGQRPG